MSPSIWGSVSDPLPNEVITVVALVVALGGLVVLIRFTATRGLAAFRASAWFLLAASVAFSAYWAAYSWSLR